MGSAWAPPAYHGHPVPPRSRSARVCFMFWLPPALRLPEFTVEREQTWGGVRVVWELGFAD